MKSKLNKLCNNGEFELELTATLHLIARMLG
jgi:hypothetical protein